jgi:hypothetical protein
MYNWVVYLHFLIAFFQMGEAIAQPIINERYIINSEETSVFSSVISTDSCYYVVGYQTSVSGFENMQSSFIKFNFDGTIDSVSVVSNDTLGITFFNHSKLIKTLDDQFAQLAVAKSEDDPFSFVLIKLNASGDTLFTKFFPQFFEEDLSNGKNPSTLIQNADSSYFGLVHVQHDVNFLGGVSFFKLDKYGNLLYKRNYYGASLATYNTLRSASMLRYSENRLIIGGAYRKDNGITENQRHHTKLIVIDTLGEIVEEHTYWDDLLSLDCNSLTKAADGGLLYCGRNGGYNSEDENIYYKNRIVKLNSDFTVDWQLSLGDSMVFAYLGLHQIMALNDSEFVAVGFMRNNIPTNYNQNGYLVKFNIQGEKIWERKYTKIPHEHLASNYPALELYDVSLTSDEGFVMVGQGINYYDDNGELPGQKAWLVKTDRYGCLVPNCQYIGVETEPIDTTDTTDTTIVIPPTPPVTWLFPNPATEFLFYYHHQDNFQPVTATIYSTSGQLVQKWEITENDVTYEIDVSQFAAGTYLLKVANHLGEVLRIERFVKV